MAGRGHNLKNADGTVNLEGLSGHVADLKAKYAQNARNFEANTGQPMNMKNAGAEGQGEVGQARGDADHDGPEGFADKEQPKGESGQTRDSQPGGSVGTQDHGSRV
ncbi:hypothetical protein BDZ90DRAFT_231316 [Jaminaea rosea]|uniref:Uncharacterized protein n=1 Tax=Jaminaea rosea TaxID=1569628 RepID=A0A316UU54_9BASI|nr:hypothetical protein BDZ90DRAFT_231316 [Jaminaea rosea]PWN28328.1 hypothetical protein BDZ90DRAFT_231316 [Jaminaea rosea]